MEKRRVTTCPDAEVVAAWVDQGLDPAARAAVTAHLADCNDCRMLVANVLRITDAVRETLTNQERQKEPLPVTRTAGRQWVRWGGGALAAAAALLLVVRAQPEWLPFGSRDDAGSRLADLVQAVGDRRTVEGRLSGGFAYGPLRAPVRSGGSTAAEDNWTLLAAAARIREEAERQPVAANLHALGLAYLVRGQHDEAVRALEDATAEDAGSARFQSDLAAAYLARATATDRPEDFTRALTGAERAIKADGTLLEARFNRALALESLFLTDQARQAWHEYLELDASSPWADEARQHLERLGASQPHPELARNHSPPEVSDRTVEAALDWLVQRGLPDLADAILANDPSTASARRVQLLALAGSISELSGDRFPLDAIPAITRRAPSAISAIKQMGAGLAAAQSDDMVTAERELTPACPALEEPLAALCGLEMGRFAVQRGNGAAARRHTERALLLARQRGYSYIEGYALRFKAYSSLWEGDVAAALPSLRDAFAIFERAQYLAQGGFVANQLADLLDYTGLADEAWRWRRVGLRAAARTRVPRLEYISRSSAAGVLSAKHQYEASGKFTEAIGYPDAETLPPLMRVSRELKRAKALVALGDLNGARDAAEDARRVLDRSDDRRAQSLRADLLAQLGEIAALENDLPVADATLSQAVDLMGPVRAAQRGASLLTRAMVRSRLAQHGAAANDVSEALTMLSNRAAKDPWQPLRLDDAPAAFDAIGELVKSNADLQGIRGLLLVERLRELLDGIPSTLRLGTDEQLAGALARVRPDQVLVCYLFRGDQELLAWTVSPGGHVAFTVLPVTSAEVTRLVNLLTVQITRTPNREKEWTDTLGALHDLLFRGLPALEAARELIVIPDGVLNRVPFGSLHNRRTRRFQFEHRAVSVTPNLVFATGRVANARPHSAQSVVVVGEPALEGDSGRRFDRLPRARVEAAAVAGLYPRSTLLVGAGATKPDVIAGLGSRDVLHFAGHALVPVDGYAGPRLLLAGAIEDAATSLRAEDLIARRVPVPSRVVLAACETGAATGDRAAGVASLAAVFLRAGTLAVAGTLWPVEDTGTEEFFLTLHRGLMDGGTMAAAVTRAQSACLGSVTCRRAAATWVGTTAFGSS
jgi:CHAT domain-containing protein/tetratricopeptide (TPR) repeat protein